MVIELLENWSTPVNRILPDYFSHYDVVAAAAVADDDDDDDDDHIDFHCYMRFI